MPILIHSGKKVTERFLRLDKREALKEQRMIRLFRNGSLSERGKVILGRLIVKRQMRWGRCSVRYVVNHPRYRQVKRWAQLELERSMRSATAQWSILRRNMVKIREDLKIPA